MATAKRPGIEIKNSNGSSSPAQEALQSMALAVALKEVLGGAIVDEVIPDDSVKLTDDPFIAIPAGMGYGLAIRTLQRKQEQEEETMSFSRTFMYRPFDGAYAFAMCVKEMFGMTLQKAIPMLFGTRKPELIEVEVEHGKKIQIPWGLIEIPQLEGGQFHIAATHNEDFGTVFRITGEAKRKYRGQVERLFDAVSEYLKTSSIYRGKAIFGSNKPEFMNLKDFDRNSVIYAQEIEEMLDAVLWAPIRYTAAMERDGISLKRAILLSGPYGCGKTLTGQRTASIAVENGWTFISARPNKDDLIDVLRTARLYQPAVVFFEDVDGATSSSDSDEVSVLLDAFDGITAKGGKIVVCMTTNHIERIHKGMLRPGRLDALVEFGALDLVATERLIQSLVKRENLDSDIDYNLIYEAMSEFLPAFITEAVNRASTVAINRVEGANRYMLTTDDLVIAANTLRPQLQIMNEAKEGERLPTLDRVVRDITRDALDGSPLHTEGEKDEVQLRLNSKEAAPVK